SLRAAAGPDQCTLNHEEPAKEWSAISEAVLQTSTWTSFDGRKVDVDEGTWMTSVSPIGADHILTGVADIFDVDGE
ncbi:MAG: hypothetical protein L0L97_12245, partial [Corynebacterium glyciniphilum]|nr:hypothetical protein [Corynebacterium glyciniphilum]